MPPIAAQLVKSPMRSQADLSSVKFIHSAASPLGVELMKELMKMFNLPFVSQSKYHLYLPFLSLKKSILIQRKAIETQNAAA